MPPVSLNQIALALSITSTALGQTLLRLGARDKASVSAAIYNVKTLAGYALFMVVVVLQIYALQRIPLRTVMAIDSLVYILTPLTAWWLAKDPLTLRMMICSAVIAVGIVVFFM